MNYVVTIAYDPGTPVDYLVLGAPSAREAQNAALLAVGYNPGVPIHTCAAGSDAAKWIKNVVNYAPLTAAQAEQIRYND